MTPAQRTGAAVAAVIAIAVPVVAQFEGLWLTAKVDTIGTGKPLTWCYGETEGPVKLRQVHQGRYLGQDAGRVRILCLQRRLIRLLQIYGGSQAERWRYARGL